MATDTKIIYVTREIERALGTTPNERYIIVSNKTRYGESIKAQYPDSVILIENPDKKLLGTTDLLAHQVTKDLIASMSDPITPNP
ncbi:MAG: hypothetical protein WCG02_02480, partial [Candidatus Taylorbacteria bacterium]